MRFPFRLIFAALLAAFAWSAGSAHAQQVAPPGELIVRFAPAADAGERRDLRARAGVDLATALPVSGLQLVEAEPGQTAAAAERALERSDSVLYAEPNYYRTTSPRPSDPLFRLQWGFENVGQSGGLAGADVSAVEAWDVTTGSPSTTIAVVDTGVLLAHTDLAGADWTNAGESGSGRETNGVDDDGNGLRDDVRGWDWVGDERDPTDENGHGTHVAGTAAARSNNSLGVAGTSWGSKVMPLRVLDADGSGTVADVVAAYRYAAAEGAQIVNASLGSSSFSLAERDAIAAAPGTLFVVAAGNGGADGVGDNNDIAPEYPCAYPLVNVVCVAATDRSDRLASFSNFGPGAVDLAAPGVEILSTWLNGGYSYLSGTSMATPHVSGAAALLLSAEPSLSTGDLRAALLDGVDRLDSLNGRVASGGRLNIARSLEIAAPGSAPRPTDPGATPSPAPPQGVAPPPAPAPALDRRPPQLALGSPARQPLREALRRGVRARIACTEACTIRLRVVLDPPSARRARLGRRAVPVGSYRVSLRAERQVAIRLTRRARARLARLQRAGLTIEARATDPAGNADGARRRLVLAGR